MTRTGELNEMAANVSAAQRRSYIGIAAALLALVFVIVAGAILFNRQLRPRVGIEAIAGPSALQGSEASASRTISSESEIGLLATPLLREVGTAYLNYWQVYASAAESLDSARLVEVAVGDRLEEAVAEIADLRTAGRAAKVQVRHSFAVLSASQDEASVRDKYENSSYIIDPVSKQPVGVPGKSQNTTVSYSLRRINGVWKVTEAIREAGHLP